jgi:pimeloyl-ACP methyl ester carboxylesterase
MNATKPPVIFIHGLWLHASSWGAWIDRFASRGYTATAPGWPDEPPTVEEARLSPERVANRGIEQLFEHFSAIVRSCSTPPILIGHSFGGLLVEKLLGENLGCAGVAIDPAQIKGVLPLPLAQLRSALPALGNPLNISRAIALTSDQFRFGFGNALSAEESDELYNRWAIPSPVRGLFEAALANFTWHSPAAANTQNPDRGPLLLISGTADHTVPDVTTRAAFRLYRHSTATTELKQFEGRGHSLTIDHGWPDIADAILTWLDALSFGKAPGELLAGQREAASS